MDMPEEDQCPVGTKLLVLVITRRNAFRTREAIRHSWAKDAVINITVIFFKSFHKYYHIGHCKHTKFSFPIKKIQIVTYMVLDFRHSDPFLRSRSGQQNIQGKRSGTNKFER